MMTLKTNPLNFLAFSLLLLSQTVGAEGINPFDCLRDLMPPTDRGTFQSKRKQVERPFMINDKWLVFPEIKGRQLTGFYLYDHGGAYYYDTIEAHRESHTERTAIAQLPGGDRTVYQMVVQPTGLETVTIYYMPGFDSKDTNSSGPVVLGTSVLPVFGAFVSRPETYNNVYQNPTAVPEGRLRESLSQTPGRHPAAASNVKIEHKIVSLSAGAARTPEQLWAPLKQEMKMRMAYVSAHNLDDRSFKETQKALNGSCKAQ